MNRYRLLFILGALTLYGVGGFFAHWLIGSEGVAVFFAIVVIVSVLRDSKTLS